MSSLQVNLCQNRLGGHKRCQSRSRRPAVPSDPPVFLLVWFGKYQFWANGTNTPNLNCCIWEHIPSSLTFHQHMGWSEVTTFFALSCYLDLLVKDAWRSFPKSILQAWWWTMVVYRGTICKKITLRTKSKFGYPLRQLTYPAKKKALLSRWYSKLPQGGIC